MYFITQLGQESAFHRIIMREVSNVRLTKQANIQQVNQQISSAFVYKKNEQIINSIYLETVFVGNRKLTSEQQKAISGIASLCPMEGGPDAIFQARGLAALFRIKFKPTECKRVGIKFAKVRDLVGQGK